jgi:hypothetical protein
MTLSTTTQMLCCAECSVLIIVMLNVVIISVFILNVIMLSSKCRYAECIYSKCRHAECRYPECLHTECHYAECCGAPFVCLTEKNLRANCSSHAHSINFFTTVNYDCRKSLIDLCMPPPQAVFQE